jgi:DNA-binding transcriptional regulator PaaX
MRASVEEFLLILLWTADGLARASWRNLDGSFEAWAYRNGLGRRLAYLARQKLIERQPPAPTHSTERIIRLTQAGRLQALGGRDPVERWERPWDGKWRLVLFDVADAALRFRLRRHLRRHSFGYLQNSVWITPDSVVAIRRLLAGVKPDVETCAFLEGRPCGGESDAAIVTGAWDFARINTDYRRYLEFAARPPQFAGEPAQRLARLRAFLQRERALWSAAVRGDPLLPRMLLPADYAGRRAWDARCALLGAVSRIFAA